MHLHHRDLTRDPKVAASTAGEREVKSLNGVFIRVWFTSNQFDATKYDSKYGFEAAQRAVNGLLWSRVDYQDPLFLESNKMHAMNGCANRLTLIIIPTPAPRHSSAVCPEVPSPLFHSSLPERLRRSPCASISLTVSDIADPNLNPNARYIFCNQPGLKMNQGERVRWYNLAVGQSWDMHTPHWHGHTVLTETGHRSDEFEMLPGTVRQVHMGRGSQSL